MALRPLQTPGDSATRASMRNRIGCGVAPVRRAFAHPAERVLTDRQCLVWLLVSAWLMALIVTTAPLNRHGRLHPWPCCFENV